MTAVRAPSFTVLQSSGSLDIVDKELARVSYLAQADDNQYALVTGYGGPTIATPVNLELAPIPPKDISPGTASGSLLYRVPPAVTHVAVNGLFYGRGSLRVKVTDTTGSYIDSKGCLINYGFHATDQWDGTKILNDNVDFDTNRHIRVRPSGSQQMEWQTVILKMEFSYAPNNLRTAQLKGLFINPLHPNIET